MDSRIFFLCYLDLDFVAYFLSLFCPLNNNKYAYEYIKKKCMRMTIFFAKGFMSKSLACVCDSSNAQLLKYLKLTPFIIRLQELFHI